MTLQMVIAATEKLVDVDGVPCRVWEGRTASGLTCHVFVHRLAARNDQDPAEFERALKEVPLGRRVTLEDVLR